MVLGLSASCFTLSFDSLLDSFDLAYSAQFYGKWKEDAIMTSKSMLLDQRRSFCVHYSAVTVKSNK
jgi:hypothetical protein